MRVLAVGAHPDDLELLCGRTLARFVRHGHAVAMFHASLGDRGSFVHTSAEIANIRLEEVRTAAGIIDAEHHTLGLSDGEINAADPSQRRLAIDLIRPTRPDLILTHSPNDYMADHNEISRLMSDASHIATLPFLKTKHEAYSVVPAVYYMDTLAGAGFDATEYADISNDLDTKFKELRAHRSQLERPRDHDGVDIVERTRSVSAFRGFQCGVAHAEGFAPRPNLARAKTVRLLH
jgi:LmbE family N-acetylglucosaminyl deacetylase